MLKRQNVASTLLSDADFNPGGSFNHPCAQEDFFNRASANLHDGDSEQAVSGCLDGLEQFPNDPGLLCIAARSLIALKRLADAGTFVDRAIRFHPGFSPAHETRADLLLIQGHSAEAIKYYQQAMQLGSSRVDIQKKIDRARTMQQAKPTSAQRPQATTVADDMARAGQLARDGKPGDAEDIYREVLQRDPKHVEAIRLLAAAATAHRKHGDAEILLTRAVELAPHYTRAWLDLAASQLAQEKHPEAIASSAKVVELTPMKAESHIALANALAQADRTEDAIDSYHTALNISPRHPGAFSGLGQQLKILGRQQEAIEVFRQNIALNPRNAEPYWSLANMKTFRFRDDEMQAMLTLLEDEELEDLGTVQLCNALGLGYERLNDYGNAFKYFERCNEKRREAEFYDPVENEIMIERLMEVFSREFLDKNSGQGLSDASPIFIVGLPRSGSTLIEQILASHSLVEGTHELSDLARVAASIPRANPQRDRFPNNLPGLDPRAWAQVGKQYLGRTCKYRSDRPYFIDKNPNNFVYVGLLRLILPNAKIINARRHPLDSCFGSYKQLFASGQPFSYDLTEVGEYYLQYQQLMDHWHGVIPGAVLDVDYENVVSDLEGQVRRLLDFCGLPFEEACLNFHATDRSVKTASSEQVRQPIYASSVNLWKNYAPYLSELMEVLDPLLQEKEDGGISTTA